MKPVARVILTCRQGSGGSANQADFQAKFDQWGSWKEEHWACSPPPLLCSSPCSPSSPYFCFSPCVFRHFWYDQMMLQNQIDLQIWFLNKKSDLKGEIIKSLATLDDGQQCIKFSPLTAQISFAPLQHFCWTWQLQNPFLTLFIHWTEHIGVFSNDHLIKGKVDNLTT